MEITGRVTADAVVRRAGEKEVLNFSIAINDRYKVAGSSEYKEVTTFINCSYWLTMKAAQWIRKGAVVLLSGRLGMHVYINNEGNPIGSIDFHVNSISILAFAKRSSSKAVDGHVDASASASTDAGAGERKGKLQKGNSKTAVTKQKDNVSGDVPF